MMKIGACKKCIYFVPHYGNKDSRGSRVVSKYWCIKRNGFLKTFPKQCKQREER